MLRANNITDFYSQADNFFLFFDKEQAEEKENEIKKRGKISKSVKTGSKWTVFEIKKII